MSERAGIDVVWLWQAASDASGVGLADAIELAAELAPRLERMTIGLLVGPGESLARALGGPADVELGILPDTPEDAREVLATLMAGARSARLSVAATEIASIGPLLAVADDVILPGWHFHDLEAAAGQARSEALESGREPQSLGIAALLSVSIGRTEAEATARVRMDETFDQFGPPDRSGIFGTLEDCQDRVIALAHSGVTDLLCVVPATEDVHDVIAQLTAIAVGSTDVLRPGSLRSEAPPPPEGWGGRPEPRPSTRVSGGSRPR